MAVQIACGMSYLVRREVIHKDLAPRISVIDDNFNLRAKPIPLQSLVPHGLSLQILIAASCSREITDIKVKPQDDVNSKI